MRTDWRLSFEKAAYQSFIDTFLGYHNHTLYGALMGL
jgi:hypothetical protein